MLKPNDVQELKPKFQEEPNQELYVDETPLLEEEETKEEKIEEVKPEAKEETSAERKVQNVQIAYQISSSDKLDSGDMVILPANFVKETREVLERAPNVKLLDSPESREWARTIREGLEINTAHEAFISTLEDPEADFSHKFEHGSSNMIGGAPRFKASENKTLAGERAVIRFVTHLGLGTLFQVPLWHSGLWITFKPPGDSEIIELNRQLMNDKIMLGRYSYGLVFSNIMSYTNQRLIDFALAHVYDTNIKPEDLAIENLKDHINCQDIPSLLWGFICTMYPKGFNYRRACVTDPQKCNFILEEVLNVSKLQWTNRAALTDWQKTFMSSRIPRVKELKDVIRYKEELSKIQGKKLVINEGRDDELNISLKTPTINQYIESGFTWIDNIVDMVETAIGTTSNEEERNELIMRHGQASAMRQYGHWVEQMGYETNSVTDKETIDSLLDTMSSDDVIRSQFLDGVLNYINNSSISVIGIPAYDCPACKEPQETATTNAFHKNIMPLDVVQLFFGLLTQRLARISER